MNAFKLRRFNALSSCNACAGRSAAGERGSLVPGGLNRRLLAGNETCIRVNGEWKWLFRAVDKEGRTADFLLTHRRYAKARRFLAKALRSRQDWPPLEVRFVNKLFDLPLDPGCGASQILSDRR